MCKPPYTYTAREEFANAFIHGIGALLSLVALIVLIDKSSQQSAVHFISFSIYGSSMILLYISSALAHCLRDGKAKNFWLVMDHVSINLFIAGSYTPLLLIVIKGSAGAALLCAVWSIACLGIFFKLLFTNRFHYLTTFIYILKGWMIAIVFDSLAMNMAAEGLVLLVTAGLLYTIGTIFYLWRLFPYHHAIWHLFVLLGSTFQFFAMLFYVLPMRV